MPDPTQTPADSLTEPSAPAPQEQPPTEQLNAPESETQQTDAGSTPPADAVLIPPADQPPADQPPQAPAPPTPESVPQEPAPPATTNVETAAPLPEEIPTESAPETPLPEIAPKPTPTESAPQPASIQEAINKLGNELIPSAANFALTNEQKRSFWQKIMNQVKNIAVKRKQDKWEAVRKIILKLTLEKQGRIKNDNIEKAFKVSHKTASRYLKKMTDEKLLERMEKKKKTFYLWTPQGKELAEIEG